jgi:peptidoglycan/LPS O-acetylase OafA/YrhL
MAATQKIGLSAPRASGVQASHGRRGVAIDYLRTFIIVLVLLHHSVLAYVNFGHFNPQHYLWSTAPIVDSRRWLGFDIIVAFNDVFFMSLMFFVSGLFVWPSLSRKHPGQFLRDRMLRLGLPFAVAVTFLMPLAYYPSYLMTGAAPGYFRFWRDTILVGPWGAGPPWFVAVLLAYDCLAALVHWVAPGAGDSLKHASPRIFARPLIFFILLVAFSAAAFFPMLIAFGSSYWFAFGPLAVQACRALHYAVYFFAGVAVGAYGLERSGFAPGGALARQSWLWVLATLLSFFAFLVTIGKPSPPVGPYGSWFVVSCATISFAMLALFLRFSTRRYAIIESLNDNAYGIYLVHYLFVIWLQYALLDANLPAIAKASMVFVAVLALSWGTVAALRRVPVIARTI